MPMRFRPACSTCGRLSGCACARQRQHRGSRVYGPQHAMLREQWKTAVATGKRRCARCQEFIAPDEPWDLGHTDDHSAYSGPEHRYCNRSAAAKKRNTMYPPWRGTTVRRLRPVTAWPPAEVLRWAIANDDCPFCHQRFMKHTPNGGADCLSGHLPQAHGITTHEYRERAGLPQPGRVTMPTEWRAAIARASAPKGAATRRTNGVVPKRGDARVGGKLTEADVHAIRARVAAGEPQHVVSEAYGINQATVHHITTGEAWGWLASPTPLRQPRAYRSRVGANGVRRPTHIATIPLSHASAELDPQP